MKDYNKNTFIHQHCAYTGCRSKALTTMLQSGTLAITSLGLPLNCNNLFIGGTIAYVRDIYIVIADGQLIELYRYFAGNESAEIN